MRRGHSWFIEDFAAEDFAAICSAYLKPAVCRRLNFDEIHRFAPSLNAHQLRKASVACHPHRKPDGRTNSLWVSVEEARRAVLFPVETLMV